MVRCEHCGVNIDDMPWHCKRCGQSFCGNHRLPEDHNCAGLKKGNLFLNINPHKEEKNEERHPPKKEKPPFIELKNKVLSWLNDREYHPYHWRGRLNYIITIFSIFAVSIVAYLIFYANAEKLNSINLWIIRFSGILILISVFFILKYGWRITKETYNIAKRQKNWIRLLLVLIILIAIWQAYLSRDNLLNPLLEYKERTNFSYFNPINLNSNSGNGGGFLDSISNAFKTDPEQYRTNPKTVNLGNFNFVVYGGVNDYLASLERSISYSYTPPSTKDFIMRDLNNHVQDYYLQPFVQKIQEQTTDKKQQALDAIRIVQGIPYDWDAFKTNSVSGRYPYEVLYDMKGVCMEKSDLLAYVLRDLGFGVAIFEFNTESHRAVGIKCNNGNYHTNYCFIEATDYYPVGQIPTNYVGGVDIRNAIPEVVIISEGDTFG